MHHNSSPISDMSLDQTPLRAGRSKGQYMCSTPFSNELPSLPFDPKLLEHDFNPERFCAHRRTTLDAAIQHELHGDSEFGKVPIDLIDPSIYSRARNQGLDLAVEDAALLTLCERSLEEDGLLATKTDAGDETKSNKAKTQAQGKGKGKGKGKRASMGARPEGPKRVFGEEMVVSWLRQPDMMDPTFKETRPGLVKEKRNRAAGAAEDTKQKKAVKSEADMAKDIEKSFEQVKGAIRHPRKGNEEPVAVISVLPDVRRVEKNLVQITTDMPLTMNAQRNSGVVVEQQSELEYEFEAYLIEHEVTDESVLEARYITKAKKRRVEQDQDAEKEKAEGEGEGGEEFNIVKTLVYNDFEQFDFNDEDDDDAQERLRNPNQFMVLEIHDSEAGSHASFAPLHSRAVLKRKVVPVDLDAVRSHSREPTVCIVTKRKPTEDEEKHDIKVMYRRFGMVGGEDES